MDWISAWLLNREFRDSEFKYLMVSRIMIIKLFVYFENEIELYFASVFDELHI